MGNVGFYINWNLHLSQ